MEKNTIVKGIKCNECGKELPEHTIAQHLDKNAPIHKCPHETPAVVTMNFKMEKYFASPKYLRTMIKLLENMEADSYLVNVIMTDGRVIQINEPLSKQKAKEILLHIETA